MKKALRIPGTVSRSWYSLQKLWNSTQVYCILNNIYPALGSFFMPFLQEVVMQKQ
jgi:hypothetical protein